MPKRDEISIQRDRADFRSTCQCVNGVRPNFNSPGVQILKCGCGVTRIVQEKKIESAAGVSVELYDCANPRIRRRSTREFN